MPSAIMHSSSPNFGSGNSPTRKIKSRLRSESLLNECEPGCSYQPRIPRLSSNLDNLALLCSGETLANSRACNPSSLRFLPRPPLIQFMVVQEAPPRCHPVMLGSKTGFRVTAGTGFLPNGSLV